MGSGSGMNIPDHISESLGTIFGLKYLNCVMRIRIRNQEVFLTLDSGSGMGKNSDPGSGVNIYIGSATLVYLLVRGNDSFLGIFLGIV